MTPQPNIAPVLPTRGVTSPMDVSSLNWPGCVNPWPGLLSWGA